MAISKRDKDAKWHRAFAREEDYFTSLAEISLFEKGIKNPSHLQLEIEALFLAYKFPQPSIALAKFSELELACLLLAAWGFEIEKTAEVLGMKEDSVNKRRAKISEKLKSKNISNSVFKAQQAGILTFDNVDFLLQPQKKKPLFIPKNIETEELENAPC